MKILHDTDDIKMGIWGMKERVEAIGGRFIVKSSPGQGTGIRVMV